MYANYFDSVCSNYFRKSVGIKNTFHHSHKKRKDSLELGLSVRKQVKSLGRFRFCSVKYRELIG